MEGKKYLQNIWSRILMLGVLLACFAVVCIHKGLDRQNQEELPVGQLLNSNRPPFVVVSANYHDTVYRIVVREEINYLKEKYQKTFECALNENGILNIDSATYSLLETKIVRPQYRIDSVYNGEVENLISAFFNEQGAISVFLSDEEIKYLIDILFQNDILVNVDCETGMVIVSK